MIYRTSPGSAQVPRQNVWFDVAHWSMDPVPVAISRPFGPNDWSCMAAEPKMPVRLPAVPYSTSEGVVYVFISMEGCVGRAPSPRADPGPIGWRPRMSGLKRDRRRAVRVKNPLSLLKEAVQFQAVQPPGAYTTRLWCAFGTFFALR